MDFNDSEIFAMSQNLRVDSSMEHFDESSLDRDILTFVEGLNDVSDYEEENEEVEDDIEGFSAILM